MDTSSNPWKVWKAGAQDRSPAACVLHDSSDVASGNIKIIKFSGYSPVPINGFSLSTSRIASKLPNQGLLMILGLVVRKIC
jgi:hypothetical protein